MIIDPDTSNIFLVWRLTTLPNIPENADNFSQNLKPQKKLRCPKLERQDFWPCFPSLEAPGLRWSWRPPRHLCSAKALQPRLCPSMPPCGAASHLRRLSQGRRPRGRSRGDDKSCAQLSSTGSTDKRTMNVSGLNIFTSVTKKSQTH